MEKKRHEQRSGLESEDLAKVKEEQEDKSLTRNTPSILSDLKQAKMPTYLDTSASKPLDETQV